MKKPQISENEIERLQVLRSYEILDTAPEQAFDEITQLAAQICEAPIAVVSLVDNDRQWFKSAYGLNAKETPRDIAFCAHAIHERNVFLVPDARKDERFHDNPLVTGDTKIRFYAGAPLEDISGLALGTLCVIGHEAKELRPDQALALQILARQVVTQMRLRLELKKSHEALARSQKLEDSLRAEKERLRVLADSSPTFIFMTDAQGYSTYVNQSWLDFTGSTFEAETKGGWAERLYPEDQLSFFELFRQSLAARSSYRTSVRFLDRHGNYRWVSNQGTPHHDPAGNFVGYIWNCVDIHDLKTNTEALTESRNFLRSILDNLPVAMFCKDIERGFEYTLWNQMSEKIFGFSQEEVIGKSDYSLYPKDQADTALEEALSVLSSNSPVHSMDEIATISQVGNRTLNTIKAPIRDINGTPRYLLVVAQDITDRKRAELQLLHTSKMSSLGEMAGSIAHEINNPLAIIHGRITALIEDILAQRVDTNGMVATLRKVSDTSMRIAKIVKGLRMISRDADRDPFSLSNVHQIFEETFELCRQRFKNNLVELRVSPKVELALECRPAQISQVLLNLLNNAYDAVQGSEGSWVEITAVDQVDSVIISVTDSGRGIPKDIVARMLEPFFTTKQAGQGTGLGLSIAKNIIEDHGGQLTYDSQSSHTRFVISLPKKQIERRKNFKAA